jgi:hypothetical protein
MRALADKLLDHPGHVADNDMSEFNAKQARMRRFKDGGAVKKDSSGHVDIFIEKKAGGSVKNKSCSKTSATQKYAAGGAAKIRHKQATKAGKALPASHVKKTK